ncbi:MAG TPA: hypothetical protein VD840_08115 [Sinorhizobium sp.]|nr:hypothetical protein [Sinorhizobium sp.]
MPPLKGRTINKEADMAISKTFGRSVVALALALAPLASVTVGTPGVAFAKGGNGGGNSGGGGGGNGGGNGGGHGGGHSGNGKSAERTSKSSSDRGGNILKSLFKDGTKSKKTVKAEKVGKASKAAAVKLANTTSDTAALNSLNRNYHAYLNSNDPRMAAISAYAIAYAEFEAENGVDAIPTDPALSDAALSDALASFTKGGVVTDETLADAKEILGVGPAVGKIDQIRETLPETESETIIVDPDTAD